MPFDRNRMRDDCHLALPRMRPRHSTRVWASYCWPFKRHLFGIHANRSNILGSLSFSIEKSMGGQMQNVEGRGPRELKAWEMAAA